MEFANDKFDNLEKTISNISTPNHDIVCDSFKKRSNFSSLDVDKVISEAQDSLLSTSLDQIRNCNVSSFNDILDDICEMNNILEFERATSKTNESQQSSANTTLQSPLFYHMPDLGPQTEEYTPDCSFTNQNDLLHPLSTWPEFLTTPPPALSTVTEIPQLAPIPTPESPPKMPIKNKNEIYSINVSLSNGEQQFTPTGVPTINYHSTPTPIITPQCIQQFENSNFTTIFLTPPLEKTRKVCSSKEHTPVGSKKKAVQKEPSRFDWARVVPRKSFIQPSEVIVLRPFRTRKTAAPSRPGIDLASYFDTSSIKIPMIRDRPRTKNANRRKQKLYTIPGADNLVFEVQPALEENQVEEKEQLYPETEIPELDEIFKRKRRGIALRRTRTPQDPTFDQKPVIDKKSTFEVPCEINDTDQEILSDVESDDVPLTAIKSLKCINCRKIFKTSRSLTIHSRRCIALRQTTEKEDLVPQDIPSQGVSPKSGKSNINALSKTNERSRKSLQTCGTRPLTRSQTNSNKRKLQNSEDQHIDKKRVK